MFRYRLDVRNGIDGRFLLEKNWDAPDDDTAMRTAWQVIQYVGKQWAIPARYLAWYLWRRDPSNSALIPVTHRIPSDRTKKLGQARYG